MRSLLPLLVAIGCAPAGRLHSSRALPPGDIRFTWGSSLQLVDAGQVTFPAVEVGTGARVGVVDRLEVGLAANGFWTQPIYMLGLAADAKVELLRTDYISISPNPLFSWQRLAGSGADGHQITIGLPLIAGFHFARNRHELILAPAILDQIWMSDGAHTIHQLYVGGSVGYRWQITRRFGVLPHIASFWSPTGVEGSDGTTTISFLMATSHDL